MPEVEKLTCPACGHSYDKDCLDRDCGNCFACTGCEIYCCPNCRAEIVVKSMKKPNKNDNK